MNSILVKKSAARENCGGCQYLIKY